MELGENEPSSIRLSIIHHIIFTILYLSYYIHLIIFTILYSPYYLIHLIFFIFYSLYYIQHSPYYIYHIHQIVLFAYAESVLRWHPKSVVDFCSFLFSLFLQAKNSSHLDHLPHHCCHLLPYFRPHLRPPFVPLLLQFLLGSTSESA